jgi:MFS family permease
MCDEWTRENRIKRVSLQIQLIMPYLTGMSILSALLIFVYGSTIYNQLEKGILGIALIIVLIVLSKSFFKQKREIDNIFQPSFKAPDTKEPEQNHVLQFTPQQYNFRDAALFFASILLGIIVGVLGSIWTTYAADVLPVDKTSLFWISFIGFWALIISITGIFLYYTYKAKKGK